MKKQNFILRKLASSNFISQSKLFKWNKLFYSSYLTLCLTLPFCLPAYSSFKQRTNILPPIIKMSSQVPSY